MTEELLNALKVIKAECSKHTGVCGDCPLLKYYGGCAITDYNSQPSDWRLEKREVYF